MPPTGSGRVEGSRPRSLRSSSTSPLGRGVGGTTGPMHDWRYSRQKTLRGSAAALWDLRSRSCCTFPLSTGPPADSGSYFRPLRNGLNMVERIRAERARLRADRREDELREERAARALGGLSGDGPFQLVNGCVHAADVRWREAAAHELVASWPPSTTLSPSLTSTSHTAT